MEHSKAEFETNYSEYQGFSVKKFRSIIEQYNSIIDAIPYILKYNQRDRKYGSWNKIDTEPFESVIAGLAYIRENHTNKYNALSSGLTTKMFGLLEDYEAKFAEIKLKLSYMKYDYSLDIILAFDKLFYEFKHLPKNIKPSQDWKDLNTFITATKAYIPKPLNKKFDGYLTFEDAMILNTTLRDMNVFINIWWLYDSLQKLESIKQSISESKLKKKREATYKFTQKIQRLHIDYRN